VKRFYNTTISFPRGVWEALDSYSRGIGWSRSALLYSAWSLYKEKYPVFRGWRTQYMWDLCEARRRMVHLSDVLDPRYGDETVVVSLSLSSAVVDEIVDYFKCIPLPPGSLIKEVLIWYAETHVLEGAL